MEIKFDAISALIGILLGIGGAVLSGIRAHYKALQRLSDLETRVSTALALDERLRALENTTSALTQRVTSEVAALGKRQDNHVAHLTTIEGKIDALLEKL